MRPSGISLLACGFLCIGIAAQNIPEKAAGKTKTQVQTAGQSLSDLPPDYLLGPGDQVTVHVLDLEEIPDEPVRVDPRGNFTLPLAGEIHASGQTIKQVEADIQNRLRSYLKQPVVNVALSESRGQAITVLGAVNAPGAKRMDLGRTLMDAISDAGGLRPDAGPVVKVTRRAASGAIPVAHSRLDEDSGLYVAEIGTASLLHAQNPRENIVLKAHDVITVPVAEMIYVLGEVVRPGGYEVKESQTISILNAVALAGGATRNASSSRAKVLRHVAGKKDRTEFVVDLNQMLAGSGKDFELEPEDILYLPTNKGKVITTRALEAMIGTGSSIAVFRGSR